MKERASKAVPVVRQAKILLDAERPGPDGVPRSKGIGFVEFAEHEHALCALRQLNNNPKAFAKVRCAAAEQQHNKSRLMWMCAELAAAPRPHPPVATSPPCRSGAR